MTDQDAACAVAAGIHTELEKPAPNLHGVKQIGTDSKLLLQDLTVDDAIKAVMSADLSNKHPLVAVIPGQSERI